MRASPVRVGRAFRATADWVEALVPPACAVCRVAVEPGRAPVCALCRSRVAEMAPPRCPRCGLTRVVPADDRECGDCHAWPGFLPRAASACLHDGVPAELVRGLKYRGWTALAAFMAGRMLRPALEVAGGDEPVLVPVPLTPSRRRERGFNQAALLAAVIGRRLGWPTRELLKRTRGGPSHARLGRHRRARQAAGAFALAHDSGLRGDGRKVLLVDDVITTGATATGCAAALDAAGYHLLGAVSFTRADALAVGS